MMTDNSRHSHILLIDDSDFDNLINEQIVKASGFASTITIKQSAMEALDFLRASNSPNLPSIIFLDLMMPEMDGFDFLEQFDKLEDHIRNNCKVVVISSSIDHDDIERAQSNKYVIKFISKPLKEDELNDIKYF